MPPLLDISSVRIHQHANDSYNTLSITQGFGFGAFFQKCLLCQRHTDDLTVPLEGKRFLH